MTKLSNLYTYAVKRIETILWQSQDVLLIIPSQDQNMIQINITGNFATQFFTSFISGSSNLYIFDAEYLSLTNELIVIALDNTGKSN